VLHNLFIDRARRKSRSPIVEMREEHHNPAAACTAVPDPEALATQGDGELSLERAWARLESKQQVLLLLRAEGHSLTELSRITEVAKPALSVQLHRARSRLARLIAEERSDADSLRACSGRTT
jgi:DNA-directed RNA polymerase specialized sigma24 family protein